MFLNEVHIYALGICGDWGQLASHKVTLTHSRLGIQVSLAISVCLSGLWLGGLLYLSANSIAKHMKHSKHCMYYIILHNNHTHVCVCVYIVLIIHSAECE